MFWGGGETAIGIYVSLFAELEEAAAGAITVELESKEIQDFDNYMFWGRGEDRCLYLCKSVCRA
jgi:hypothetical protein